MRVTVSWSDRSDFHIYPVCQVAVTCRYSLYLEKGLAGEAAVLEGTLASMELG